MKGLGNNNNNIISRGWHVWHECQSIIWSWITNVNMSLMTEQVEIIHSMYRAGEVSVHRACCERATQPYSRGGGGGVRFAQAQDQQVTRDVTTRNPRIVTECLLTCAMLIKLYVHVHGTVYFGSLVFQFIWLCFFSTVTVTLMTHFGLWTLFSSELKMLNTLVLFTFMMSASPLWNF